MSVEGCREGSISVVEAPDDVLQQTEEPSDRPEPVRRVVDELAAERQQRRVQLGAQLAGLDPGGQLGKQGDGRQPVQLVANRAPARAELVDDGGDVDETVGLEVDQPEAGAQDRQPRRGVDRCG